MRADRGRTRWPGWPKACIRVFMVSTGYIATCSAMPATAPAAMCCAPRPRQTGGRLGVHVHVQAGGAGRAAPPGRSSRPRAARGRLWMRRPVRWRPPAHGTTIPPPECPAGLPVRSTLVRNQRCLQGQGPGARRRCLPCPRRRHHWPHCPRRWWPARWPAGFVRTMQRHKTWDSHPRRSYATCPIMPKLRGRLSARLSQLERALRRRLSMLTTARNTH